MTWSVRHARVMVTYTLWPALSSHLRLRENSRSPLGLGRREELVCGHLLDKGGSQAVLPSQTCCCIALSLLYGSAALHAAANSTQRLVSLALNRASATRETSLKNSVSKLCCYRQFRCCLERCKGALLCRMKNKHKGCLERRNFVLWWRCWLHHFPWPDSALPHSPQHLPAGSSRCPSWIVQDSAPCWWSQAAI